MRHLAITGMVTAFMIDLMRAGSDMRATPPSRRMSAGTRSSAMTAQAPASSAIFACSAVTTSMITPPLSISARPPLTLIVPTSCMDRILARGRREKRLDGDTERLGLLEEREVTRIIEDHELRSADAVGERSSGRRSADEVVATGDHERLGADPVQVGPQVERRRVERAERLGQQALDLDKRPEALVPSREVERRHRVPHRGDVLRRLVVAGLLTLERGQRCRVPRLAGLPVDRALCFL